MDPEFDEAEALEQAELRKRLEEEAAEEQSHRETEAWRPEHHGPDREWKPPEETMVRTKGRVLLRFFVFLLLLAGLWFLVQQGSQIFFQPELEALGPVVPDQRFPSGRPVTVGVRMGNTAAFDGNGFAVAALASGEEVQGPVVEVPANDTVVAPVNLALPVGDHVFSLIAFSAGDEDRRLATFRGLTLWISDREVRIDSVALPEVLQLSDTVVVEFSGTNPGDSPETVIPVFVFTSAEGDGIELAGFPAELPPGETGTLQVTIVASDLEPGPYTVRVLARTPDGVRLARTQDSFAVRVGR